MLVINILRSNLIKFLYMYTYDFAYKNTGFKKANTQKYEF